MEQQSFFWRMPFLPSLAGATVLALASCTSAIQPSETKIVRGVRDPGHKAVVMMQGRVPCSGTFVSHNTMVSAAHCVIFDHKDSAGNIPPLISNATLEDGTKSVGIYVHPNYPYTPDASAHDIAVVVFPRKTSKEWIGLGSRSPKRGEAFTIVGFGQRDHDTPLATPYRQRGTNTVKKVSRDEILFWAPRSEPQGGSGEGATPSFGDSGGAMLFNDKLVGVISGRKKHFRAPGRWAEVVADLTTTSNRNFLRFTQSKGASLNGL